MAVKRSFSAWVAAGILACVADLSGAVTPDRAGPEFFENRIRPVLAEQCFECHSSAAGKSKGGLRLDSLASLLTGGDQGPAIVPGKPEESLLYRAITHEDPDLMMPAKKTKLPEPVIGDFRRWIADGAVWPNSTSAITSTGPPSFDLVQRKKRWPWIWETPRQQSLPTVQLANWPVTDTDYFILAGLEAHGLAPAPPADPQTWLRRVYFALIGLPPGIHELHQFMADSSRAARERVVDTLLQSSHFGERWARHWMDLVRYAESRGHESDFIIANAYQYRDYLVRTLNADVPYDAFVREQIAGDLLPQPRLNPNTGANESVLGTGWAFLGEEVHSPVDIRQDECDRTDNKVDVLGKTFFGLTLGCARCHDHKFDAISTQDYYAMCGFVLSSSYRQVRFETMEHDRRIAQKLEVLRSESLPKVTDAVAGAWRPGLNQVAAYLSAARQLLAVSNDQPSACLDSVARLNSLEAEKLECWVGYLEKAILDPRDPLHWVAKLLADPEADRSSHVIAALAAAESLRPETCPPDARIVADYSRPELQPWKVDGPAFGTRPLQAGEVCLGQDVAHPIARVMPYGAARRDLFWSKLTIAPGNQEDSGKLAATSRAGQMLITPTFTLGCGKLHYLIRGKTRVYAAVDSHIMIEGPLHGELVQTFDATQRPEPIWVTHDLSRYSGQRVHLEFGPDGAAELEILMIVEAPEKPVWSPLVPPWMPASRVVSLQQLAASLEEALTIASARLAGNSIVGTADAPRQAALADWLLQHADLVSRPDKPGLDSTATSFFTRVRELEKTVHWESRTAVAWFDGTGVDENILIRGKASKRGAVAPRGLPAAFPGSSLIRPIASSGRYQLAEWMTDPNNPLVARVMVNRIWHYLFGRGIVATVDNFGVLGERPTQPELLDHLAWQFVHEDNWSLKKLIRRLVLSSTFGMSSKSADARADQLDSGNAFWHRMPVRRLEGEAIRDSLLAVSGRLNPAIGGLPVPVHLTEFVAGRGRPEQSGPLDGDGRRSIYTAVRRNFLPPFLVAFDFPTPFTTIGARNVSNVPAQALALMNDPFVHQQAELWSQRLMKDLQGASNEERIRWLFESAYARNPSPAEVQACRAALAELTTAQAETQASLEPWTELCHALFCANEFIYLR